MAIDAIAPTLTVAERDTLADCEEKIERGMQTFIEVGNALATVRDNHLYRAVHPTFEDYCIERWDMSRPHAYRLMSAAQVVSPIGDTDLPMPTNESQARELAKVPEDERVDVWAEAYAETGGAPTAAAVRQARERRRELVEGVDESEVPALGNEPEPDDVTGRPDPKDQLATPKEAAAAGTDNHQANRHEPADDTPATAPVFSDDPAVIERERRERGSRSFSRAVGSLWATLDPDPVEFVTGTWLPSAASPDYAVVPHVFRPDGLRMIADHLYGIAEHLESTGSYL